MRIFRFFLVLSACFFALPLSGTTMQTLCTSSVGRCSIVDFKTATDNAGNAFAAWTIQNSTNTVLQVAFKPAQQPWQLPGDPNFPPNVLSPFGLNVESFDLGVDQEGNAIVVWRINNGSNVVVQASYRPARGKSFPNPGHPSSQLNVLSPLGLSIPENATLAIASGHVVVAWGILIDGKMCAQAATKLPGGRFELTGILSDCDFSLSNPPQVGLDHLGNVVVAWRIFNGTKNVVQMAIKPISSVRFEGSTGTPVDRKNFISPSTSNVLASESAGLATPLVSIDSGNVYISWKARDDNNNTMFQAATHPF